MAQQKNGPTKVAGTPQQGQGGTAVAQGSGLTKVEGVRRALRALGKQAKPLQIQDFVKKRYHLDIATSLISFYKKDLARKERKKAQQQQTQQTTPKPTAPKPAAKKPAVPKAAPKPKPVVPVLRSTDGKPSTRRIKLEDIRTVKELLERVGADSLRTLLDLLAR
jgi:hypothetical protein